MIMLLHNLKLVEIVLSNCNFFREPSLTTTNFNFNFSSPLNFLSIHDTNFSDYINVSSISECVVSWEIRCLATFELFYSDEIPDLIMKDRSAIHYLL
jgi:hypothetical protein